MRRVRLLGWVAASIATVLFVSGCGWHLRGNVRLPSMFATTYIVADDEYTDFYRELRRALLEAGAQLSVDKRNAGTVVRVRGDTSGQRVAAVSARNTPEEFQVFYAVDYSLDVSGVELVAQQHIELTANYSYDTAAVLAKEREQRTMERALARELATQVVRRLASAKPQP